MSWSEPSEDLEFNLYYQAIQVCPCVSQDRHLILSPSTSLSLSLRRATYSSTTTHSRTVGWCVSLEQCP